MSPSSNDPMTPDRRYALCVGIGTYTHLRNRNLRFAVDDARAIARCLEGSLPDSFEVKLLTEPAQTGKAALHEAVENLLSAPDRQAEDLVVIYFSCHGDLSTPENTFYLLPSDAALQSDGNFDPTTIISISDLAGWFSQAKTHNIVMLLDVCHSGGAGVVVQHFKLNLSAGPNFFIIGGARQDQVTRQSSQLEHGLFTHCLLRAFEQPPTKEGWLTISQIHTFVSEEISWFAREYPIQIQGVSISVNPNLPLVRNPSYPELCPLPPIWNISEGRNPFFTGQEEVLARLTSTLHKEQKTALSHPQAIAGLGGIGKTQVALEYAYRHRQDYHAILWSLADTREALITTFVNIATLLDLPEKNAQNQMVTVEAVKRWLAGRSKWLLVLDNADDISIVKEFIPSAFQGHLLVTTRAQVTGALAHKIEVEVMRPDTGALLLLRRAGLIASDASLDQVSLDDQALAQKLAQEMGGLPLALDQAGAYVEEMQCDLWEYLHLYQKHRAALLTIRGELSPGHPESVATTWSLSFQKVEEKNPAAAELLRLCAYLAPDAIPEEIFKHGASFLGDILAPVAADAFLLSQAIGVLHAYSLVKRDPKGQTLSIHRLVQAVLQDTMAGTEQELWIQRVIAAMDTVFPKAEYKTWDQCKRLLPHALACTTNAQSWKNMNLGLASLLYKTARYLYNRSQYEEAAPLYQQALYIREQTLGPNHSDLAAPVAELANLYSEQGKYAEAEPLYQRALHIREPQLGQEHPETAEIIHDLARFWEVQGNGEEAKTLYARALVIREQTIGAQHPKTTETRTHLIALLHALGQHEQAIQLEMVQAES
jgi:tetratricopeptide (TPR) repeat protein